ncbi:Eukaryotic aspartyl protease family protein [Rhynchospora pubera]|uniref:Eukaryotic aspartyl protease family protein n=1 Tax=Rhynchospora pubera TaxID=906938 RepID=A0AAV8E8X7_9POAL|nr:Eukaryotic aspartyl protease family protein [Rhynchospora pubera]
MSSQDQGRFNFPPTVSLITCLLFCFQFGTTISYNALVSPIYKDSNTSLYTIPINNYKPLVLDLTNTFIWTTCSNSTKHHTIPSSSSCEAANKPGNCTIGSKDDCTTELFNPVSRKCGSGLVTFTTLTTNSTDGHNPLYAVNVTNITALCAPKKLLELLPKDSIGIAGLASSNLSLPLQLSSRANIEKQFALCLPASGRGVAIFGTGPYYLMGMVERNVSSMLKYTPLIKNHLSSSYYINVTGITINMQSLQIPETAFLGGALLSSVSPYTILREDIYHPFLSAYSTATQYIPRVTPVKPFDLCYDSRNLSSTRMGYGVPGISFTLQGGIYNWTIFGANALVMAATNAACLAFLPNQTVQNVPMVIGGFQMENNFLLFDLEKARLGMSGLLYGVMTTCNNFNYTYP